jgi:hypothetical protein
LGRLSGLEGDWIRLLSQSTNDLTQKKALNSLFLSLARRLRKEG